MEKQLLNLLQWDLIIRERDLYQHLEPFLAPIRSWQISQAEKAKQAQLRERLLEEQRQLSERLRQRSVRELAPIDTSRTYRSSSHAYLQVSPSALTERTPSLSPPSRTNSALSATSSSSTCPTPKSALGSPSYDNMPVRIFRQNSSSSIPSAIDMHFFKLRSRQPSMDQLMEEPQKKLKTGNLFTRLLSSAAAH